MAFKRGVVERRVTCMPARLDGRRHLCRLPNTLAVSATLRTGFELVKHGRAGKPHPIVLQLEAGACVHVCCVIASICAWPGGGSGDCVRWGEDDDHCIYLRDVKELCAGKTTKVRATKNLHLPTAKTRLHFTYCFQ